MLCRNSQAWELFEVHISSLLYEEVLYLGAVQDAVINGRKNRRDDIVERGSVSLRSALGFSCQWCCLSFCVSFFHVCVFFCCLVGFVLIWKLLPTATAPCLSACCDMPHHEAHGLSLRTLRKLVSKCFLLLFALVCLSQ